MQDIKWTIYWTKRPEKDIVDPPQRDSGFRTNSINQAYKELEYAIRDSEWDGFIEEWK